MNYKIQLKSLLLNMEKDRQIIENKISELPEGLLYYRTDKNKGRYLLNVPARFDSAGKSVRYQKKRSINRNEKLRDDLLQRDYYSSEAYLLLNNIDLIRGIEDSFKDIGFDDVIHGLPVRCRKMPAADFRKAVSKTFSPPRPVRDEDVPVRSLAIDYDGFDEWQWGGAPYRENTSHLENKIIKGLDGLYYRSLSEQIIASLYEKKNIPFHYDELFEIPNAQVFDGSVWPSRRFISPDFVFINRKGKFIYHEHWGMTDSPQYLMKNADKLRDYISAGIIPGKNLLITTNTDEKTLDIDLIEEDIDRYMKRQ